MGGLAGENNGQILTSYSSGSVSCTSNTCFVGGLVGGNYGNITNSYSTASVFAGSGFFGGGLAGIGTGSVSSSYATGRVSGGGGLGGLIGHSEVPGTVTRGRDESSKIPCNGTSP
jgi:The GLUG motif